MLIITDIYGNSEPLVDYEPPKRTRGVNTDHILEVAIKSTERNKRAYSLIENESTITCDGRDYVIKQSQRAMVGDTAGIVITAIHEFFVITLDNYQYEEIKGEKVLSLHQALSHSLDGTGYEFTIEDDFDGYSFEDYGDDNSLSLFQKAQKNYEFEYLIENKLITVYKQIGEETDEQIRWKYNIKTISADEDTSNFATYIKGKGKPKEDSEGNVIEGEYVVTAEYTSPQAEVYGIRHTDPVEDERFTEEPALINYMKSKLIDYPETEYTIEYTELGQNGLKKQLNIGDRLFLIHEPLDFNFFTRVVEIQDYPLNPSLKPIYTISSKREGSANRAVNDKKNNKEVKNELVKMTGKHAEFNKRIEDTIQAVSEVENRMIYVDEEMERIENEVIPEVEQAIKETNIPKQVDPPEKIPASGLWWDTSVNPPRLKRWDESKGEWNPLAPTDDEVDDLIEDMRNAAVQEGKQYTKEEIEATEKAILDELKAQTGNISKHIESLDELADSLKDRANQIDKLIDEHGDKISNMDLDIDEVENSIKATIEDVERIDDVTEANSTQIGVQAGLISAKLNSTTYQTDKNGILSDIESNRTLINATSERVDLSVTKEEFNALEIGGRNILLNTNFAEEENISKWTIWGNSARTGQSKIDSRHFLRVWSDDIKDGDTYPVRTSYHFSLKSGRDYILSWIGAESDYAELNNVYLLKTGETSPSIKGDLKREEIYKTDVYGYTKAIYKYSTKFTVGKNAETMAIQWSYRSTRDGTSWFLISEPMLEHGNIMSDWSPNPEDVSERISSAESSISVLAEGIKLKAEKSEVYTRKQMDDQLGEKVDEQVYNSKMSQLDVTVDGIQGSVSNIESDVSGTKSQLADLSIRTDGIEGSISDISSDLNGTQEQLAGLSVKADGIETSVSNVRVDLDYMSNLNIIPHNPDEWESGYITTSGNDLDRSRSLRMKNYAPVEGGKTHTLTMVEGDRCWVRQYDKNKNYVTANRNTTGTNTFKMESETRFVRVYLNDVDSVQPSAMGDTVKVKLEQGERSTSWESDARMTMAESSITQHSDQIEAKVDVDGIVNSINLSKEGILIDVNLLDINGLAGFVNNLLPQQPNNWDNGYISSSGTDVGSRKTSLKMKSYLKLNNPNVEYTLHVIDGKNMFIREYDKDKNFVATSGATRVDEGNSMTFSVGENTEYVRFYFNNNTDVEPGDIGYRLKATLTSGNRPLSWAEAESTLISGGSIISSSITAKELNVNEIFANSAIIAEIQSGIVKTSELSATQIITGELDALKISVKNLSASSIVSGELDASKVWVRNLNAEDIKTGTLMGVDITGVNITGSRIVSTLNSNDWTKIEGGYLESQGRYTRTWFGETTTQTVGLQLKGGYFRAENYEENKRLYYSDRGISTFLRGYDDEDPNSEYHGSGVIEFFSHQYDKDVRGLTLFSNRGTIGLKTSTRDIILDSDRDVNIMASRGTVTLMPNDENRSGNNHFVFYVKKNEGASDTDGTIRYGSPNTNYGSGIRFKKSSSGRSEIYATNGNGDFNTGDFVADRFNGSLVAPSDNAYVMVTDNLRVTTRSGHNNGNPNYRDIQARDLTINSIRALASDGNFYIGVGSGTSRLRVTNREMYNDGNTIYRAVQSAGLLTGSTNLYLGASGEVKVVSKSVGSWGQANSEMNFKPIRARSFPTSTSLRKNKTDIEVFNEDVLSQIKHAHAYTYRIKGDEPNCHKQLGLMVDETSRLIHGDAGDSIEMYALGTYVYRGVQQLAERDDEKDERIKLQDEKIKQLKQRIEHLEDKIIL